MGLVAAFRSRSNPPSGERAMSWGGFQQMISSYSDGIPVTVQRALMTSAVWSCVDIIASSISETPFHTYRKAGGHRELVDPGAPIVHSPSGIVTPDVWRYQAAESMLTDGNTYGEITGWTAAGRPTTIELINAGDVTDRRIADGIPQIRVGGKVRYLYPHGDIWHMPGRFVRAGSPFGLSPIEYASGAIRGALSAEKFGNDFFDSGGHPTGMLFSDDPDMNRPKAQQIIDDFMSATRNRKPGVFGSGLKYETVQANPGESKFLDLMRFAVEEACRFYRVPPSMAFAAVSGQSVTYSNATQDDLRYLKFTLNGYLIRFEHAFSALTARPQYVRAERDAVLRSSTKERHDVYALRLRDRTMSVNDVKRLEDEEPYDNPEFDLPGIPPLSPTPPEVQS